MEQEKSPVQEKNWVSWNKLKKLPTSWRRKLRNDKSNHYLSFMTLLSYLYLSTSELPPNRNIYYTFKYYSKNQKPPIGASENYYWKNTFYFNNTKSGRKYQIKLTKRSLISNPRLKAPTRVGKKKKKAAQTLSRSQPVRILFLGPISHSLVQTACVFAEWKVFIDAFPSRNLGVHQLRPKTKMVEEGT